jgi:hypothetical protein
MSRTSGVADIGGSWRRSASARAAGGKSGSSPRSTIAALAIRCNLIRGVGILISKLYYELRSFQCRWA